MMAQSQCKHCEGTLRGGCISHLLSLDFETPQTRRAFSTIIWLKPVLLNSLGYQGTSPIVVMVQIISRSAADKTDGFQYDL